MTEQDSTLHKNDTYLNKLQCTDIMLVLQTIHSLLVFCSYLVLYFSVLIIV